jgi:hypothetical protein
LVTNALLLADVTLANGQTVIASGNISITRRQDLVAFPGSPQQLRGGSLVAALGDLLGYYDAHVTGEADQHSAAAILYPGSASTWADASTIASGSVQTAIDSIPTKLANETSSASGARAIGVEAITSAGGTVIAAGSLYSYLLSARSSTLLDYGGSGAFADGRSLPAASVSSTFSTFVSLLAGSGSQPGLELVGFHPVGNFVSTNAYAAMSELTSTADGNDGALRIGAQPWGNFVGVTVRGQLIELTDTGTGNDGALRIGAEVKGTFTANTVRGQLDNLDATKAALTALAAETGTTGESLIGGAALTGTAFSLAAGTLAAQLQSIINQSTPRIDVQTFVANGTWNKPTWATSTSTVEIILIASGGSAGSGARTTGTETSGGAGGGGGGTTHRTVLAGALPATVGVTVGASVAGGNAQTSNNSNGNPGNTGNPTIFNIGTGAALIAYGGSPGGGGVIGGASTGGAGGVGDVPGGNGAGGVEGGPGGSAGLQVAGGGCPGGAAGGGIDNTPTGYAGGAGGTPSGLDVSGAPGGASPGGTGASPAALPYAAAGPSAGGGGAFSGPGGTPANYGAGGSGGGSSLNGSPSGAGSASAPGVCIVITRP